MKLCLPLLALTLLVPTLAAHSQQPPAPPDSNGGLAFFVQAMKSAPGCLGIEQGKVKGGRLALFGWFKDAKSADAFIGGPICQGMRQMARVPDSATVTPKPVAGPVLVVASFTPSKKPDAPLSLAQIAVERMVPVTGGFAYGDRFAPGSVAVPGMGFQPRQKATGDAPPAKPGQGLDMNGLMPALKKSPGCLQVDAMQCDSGKLVIVAWFANKKAAIAWYGSDMHSKMMTAMPPPTRGPLAEVKDNVSPIVVFASITPSKIVDPYLKMPLSQIAIEMYTTTPGGFMRGGRFGPALSGK
jgi:quinol monooxygenase YgiN